MYTVIPIGGYNMSNIFDLLDSRGSRYHIVKTDEVSNEAVLELVEKAVQKTPSAFNSQSQRAVVLFGANSDKFWDLTLEELRKVAPEEGFENTVAKVNSFKTGNGTILFYTDNSVTQGLQEQFALYAAGFPTWAQQESAMMQLVTWVALDELGLGGTLQHYNPLVDEVVRNEFNIPAEWELVAQMPFGKPVGEHQPTDKSDVDAKVLSF